MKIKPFGDRILVVPMPTEETFPGTKLYIPETAKEKPQICTIAEVGAGKQFFDANGKWHIEPLRVKSGQKVFVTKYGGSEIKVDGVEYKVITQDDILAILE